MAMGPERPMTRNGCARIVVVAADSFEDRRQEPLTRRCAWCGFVAHGEQWGPERRDAARSATDTICVLCLASMVEPETTGG